MTRRMGVVAVLVGGALTAGAAVARAEPRTQERPTAKPVAILLDTDIAGDCDDVGTVAVLHALADLGEAKILGIVVNTTSPWGPRCVDAINTYYGRPDIPIGVAKKGLAVKSKYARKVAETCPHDLDAKDIPDAVALYRKLLAAQPDRSVVIVSVGFLNNLEGLLRADAALVARKVKRLCVMGGKYPRGREYNFYKVASATRYVVANWPGEILFSGFEIGSAVMTGSTLARRTPPSNPVRLAYRLHRGGEGRSRQSWDQTALLAGVRGPTRYWSVVSQGHCDVNADGSSEWKAAPDRDHSYLSWDQAPATPADVTKVIEALMTRPPRARKTGVVPGERQAMNAPRSVDCPQDPLSGWRWPP